MIFSNYKNVIQPQNQSIRPYPLGFRTLNVRTLNVRTLNVRTLNNTPITSVSVPDITPPQQTKVNKIKWGEPTWFLFHTLSYKIKPEYFDLIKNALLNNIKLICINLPCPTCAEHATTFMNGVNFDAIQTKELLIDMLFTFHNIVNKRKNFPIFTKEQFEDKYSKSNTIRIIHNFVHFYKDESFNINMISANLHRKKIVELLKIWFNNNIQYFDL